MMKKEGKKNPLQSFYICVSLWNRLEVYILPKLICWQLMPKVRNEEVGTLGMISHEDRALMDGIGAYIKEIQEKMDLPLENTRKNLLLQLENTRRNLLSRRWPSPTMLAPWSRLSQLPALWEINVYYLRHPVYGILLERLTQTKKKVFLNSWHPHSFSAPGWLPDPQSVLPSRCRVSACNRWLAYWFPRGNCEMSKGRYCALLISVLSGPAVLDTQ